MAELNGNASERQLTVRHRGRIEQIGIFFIKFVKMFVYQSDWKVLPMAALIAGLVGFVMAPDFRVSMEGTLMGSFAMICVSIWNGCFNSIQSVCRERDVVKREHRSGMHITSYIAAHMMYQLILCILQVIITLVLSSMVGMNYAGKGLLTPWLVLDIGITMLLVTYAADMMALFISAICHTTTTAMTIMPFVLVFQLIFSGGVIPIPEYADPITKLTISCPGINAMASQTDINSLPYSMVSGMVDILADADVEAQITVGQVLDLLSDKDSQMISQIRSVEIGNVLTVEDILSDLTNADAYAQLRSTELIEGITLGSILSAISTVELPEEVSGFEVGLVTNVGEVVDLLAADDIIKQYRDEKFTVKTTVGEVMDIIGRDEVQKLVDKKASEAAYDPHYESTMSNIAANWLHILLFIGIFSVLSVVLLEFIDKDKR